MQATVKKHDSVLRQNTICPYFTMFPLDFPPTHLAAARSYEGRVTMRLRSRWCREHRLRVFTHVSHRTNPTCTVRRHQRAVETAPQLVYTVLPSRGQTAQQISCGARVTTAQVQDRREHTRL